MPRLPQPTLALKGHHGRLLEPLPITGPVGLRPTSYRPVTKRVLRTAAPPGLADTATAVPAGYVDVTAAARALHRPADLLMLRARTAADRLTRHVVVGGHLYFDPTDLPGVPA
jgi:hypothetical protein